MGRTFSKILGVGMVTVASLGFAGIFNKPPDNPGGAAIILALIALGGGTLLWSAFKAAPAKTQQNVLAVEQAVLRTAHALVGRVTAAEVATHHGFSVVEVQAELHRLETLGVCSSLVAESGMVVYLFNEFEDPRAKREIFYGEESQDQRAAARAAQRTPT